MMKNFIEKKLINFILFLNKKFFFKKNHPFNESKNGVMDINYSDFEYLYAKNFLDMYKNYINLDELNWKHILEVWCWWWWKLIYISETYNTTWIWIDLNKTFLKQANSKVKELKLNEKLVFKIEDALNMSFENNKFDFIILSDVLEHIPNTMKLLDECYRVLKKWWKILFDFAPYYHYFWHHIWDTIQIPWIHLITTEKFRIKLYKSSLNGFIDKDKRIDLRIWFNQDNKESFTYLNKISRKQFEQIIESFKSKNPNINININYFMLKNFNFFSKIPLLREIFIKHIIWIIKKL